MITSVVPRQDSLSRSGISNLLVRGSLSLPQLFVLHAPSETGLEEIPAGVHGTTQELGSCWLWSVLHAAVCKEEVGELLIQC